MKTKKKKYLPLYEKWMKQGRLDGGYGLCYEFDSNKFSFVYYDFKDYDLFELFFDDFYGDEFIENPGAFLELRQTIVLFLAAMNEEL